MRKVIIVAFGLFLITTSCHRRIQTNLSNTLSDGAQIEGVDIIGNIRVSTATIHQKLSTRVGDPIRVAVIRSDIKSLYSLGFKDVRVEETPGSRSGKIVRFTVVEKN